MSNPLIVATDKVLLALRHLHVWLFGALAVAAYVVLVLLRFGDIAPPDFLARYGVWIWIVAITCSTLAVARAIDTLVTAHRNSRRAAESKRALRLFPLHQQCWWHLAKQPDGSFISQFRADFEVSNQRVEPVRIVKATLLRPKMKGEIVHSEVSLPLPGSPYHSNRHPVPPRGTAEAHLHIMVRGSASRQGRRIRATFMIEDQFGDSYVIKKMLLRASQPALPNPPITQKFSSIARKLGWHSLAEKKAAAELDELRKAWKHDGTHADVDLILSEERRAYAGCGRIKGGLGSLNVGLQSGVLLRDKASSTPVDSENLGRLVKLRDGMEPYAKSTSEEYLLSHLNKDSPYADVAYFIFIALHRMGRTIDALMAARARLAGDKVWGYSNLLGTLSAVVSSEYFSIDPDLYPQIQRALEGDSEYDFGLAQKINLARLYYLDGQLRDNVVGSGT